MSTEGAIPWETVMRGTHADLDWWVERCNRMNEERRKAAKSK